MSSVAKSLVASLVSDLQVPLEKASEIVTLQDLVLYLTEEANAALHLERKVTPAASIEVANRAITASARRPIETQIFNAVRAVRSFLTLAATGVGNNLDINVYDLLPIGHPLSQAASARTNDNILKQRVSWVAAGSEIADEARPLIASAFLAPEGSIEQRYAFTLLASLPAGQVPAELLDASALATITAALGDGNSSAARRARVKLQRRDRLGRWAFMGGVSRFKARIGSNIKTVYGRYVGGTADPNIGRILVKNDRDAADGVYLVSSKNFEMIDPKQTKAVLPESAVEDAGVNWEASGVKSASDWSDKDVPKIEDIKILKINSLDEDLAENGLTLDEIAEIPDYRAGKAVAELPAEPDMLDVERAKEEPDYANGYVEGMDQTLFDGAQDITPESMPAEWSDNKKDGYSEGFRRGQVLRDRAVAWLEDSDEVPEGVDGDWSTNQLNDARDAVASAEFNRAEEIATTAEAATPAPKPAAPTTDKKSYNGPRFSDWIVPENAVKLNTGEPYLSDGMIEELSDGAATDEPAKLANIFPKEDLEQALSNSIIDGFGDLEFEGEELPSAIPGEAIYDALRQQGNDPDLTLAQAYDFLAGGAENYNEVADFKAKATAPKGETPSIETIDETVPRPTKERVLSWQNLATKAHDIVDGYRKNPFDGDEAFQQIADFINNPTNTNVNYEAILSEFADWAFSDDAAKRSAFQGLTGVMNISDADGYDFFSSLESNLDVPSAELAKFTYENFIASKFRVAKGAENPDDAESAAGNAYRMLASLTPERKAFGPLFRGVALVNQGELVSAYTTEGNVVSFDQRPFSYDQGTADTFSQRDESKAKQDYDSISFSLDSSAKIYGFDTKNTSTFASLEKEVLVSDQFRVASVESRIVTLPNGITRREHDVKLVPTSAPEPQKNELAADVATVYDLSDYSKISGAQGSNKGGVYQNNAGEQIYVKEPKSALSGENEVLASALYEAAGIDTAKIRKGKLADGKNVTFSPIIESTKDFAQKVNDPEYRKKVQEGFAVDAWLANWDVAGTGFDNIVTNKDGDPVRIDAGGALLFRAQGALKGGAFGDDVPELDTLTDSKLNSYSAAVFGEMSDEDKANSVEKLLAAFEDEGTVDALVDAAISDGSIRTLLKNKLAARKAYMAAQYQLEGVEDGAGAGEQPATGPEGEGTVPEGVGPGGRGVDGLGDSVGDSPWVSLGEPLPQPDRVKDLTEAGLKTPEIYELDSAKNAAAFRTAIEKLKENNPYAASVYVYDEDEYKQMRLFATSDGTAGFALKDGNEIVSVFVHSDSEHKGAARSLIAHGVALGGDRLDAFDTVLPKLYAKEGFTPISRVKWDSEYAPEGWDAETYKDYNNGEPDVVVMAYDPEKLDSVYDSQAGDYFDTYDEALAARNEWISSKTPEPISASDDVVFITGTSTEEIQAQLEDAIESKSVVSFVYKDSVRKVLPQSIWTNPKNGNINLYAADAEGIKKNYTISKIQADLPAEPDAFDAEPTKTVVESVNSNAIKAGDTVITPKGEQKTVTKVFLTDSGPKFTFEDGTTLLVDDNDSIDKVSPVAEVSDKEVLSGYELAKTANGAYFAPNITSDDIYALRNGEKLPPQLPFVATNDPANGNALYFDVDGTRRWGQFGAAGAVLKRDKADGTSEILVVKRSDKTSTDQGVWSVPSGAHDTAQAVSKSAATSRREVLEELGIQLGSSFADSFNVKVSDTWNFTYDVINVDPSADFDGLVTPNKEIAEFKWVTPQELQQMEANNELHPAMNAEVVSDIVNRVDNPPLGYGVASVAKATESELNAADNEYQLYPDVIVDYKYLRSTTQPNGAATYGFGSYGSVAHDTQATLLPNTDGSVDVYFNSNTDGVVKAILSNSDAAKAWAGEQISIKYGLDKNVLTGKPLGDESAATPEGSTHKGGYVKPATQPQLDAIKKMLVTKDVPEDKKVEIESALGKKDLVLGEAGQYIGYLKSLSDLPAEELPAKESTDSSVNPEVVAASLADPELTPQKDSELASADAVLDPAKILEALKLSHKDSYELENGDVVLYKTSYTTGYGKSYQYELIARRTKKERFFAYVRETDMQTGTVRVFKATKEVHSYKAVMTKLTSAKNGLTSGDPRNWFNKLSKSKVETVMASHDLSAMVDEMANAKTGSELQDSLEDLIAGLGGQSFNLDKKIIEKLQKNSANLPAGFIDNVINKMVEGKAKEAENISDKLLGIGDAPPFPHMSYNGQQLNIGDYVDWTDIKTGKVHRGKVVHVKYNHDSKGYIYSDQTLVEFDDLTNQRWRVSSNLVKVDKTAPLSEPFFAKLEENVEQQLSPVLSTTTKPDIDFAKQKAVEAYKEALEKVKLIPSKPDIDLTPAQEIGVGLEMSTPEDEVTPQANGSVIIGDEESGTYTIVQSDGTKTYYLNDVPIYETASINTDAATVDAIEDVVQTVTASPDNSVDAAEISDVLDAAAKTASTLPEPVVDEVYGEYTVKILGPDDVITTGGKKAPFKYVKSIKTTDLQVGDIIRKGVGSDKHYYQVLSFDGRNYPLARIITPTSSDAWTKKAKPHGKVSKVWHGYYETKHVYRPTEVAIADGYFKPKASKVEAAPIKVNKEGLSIFNSIDSLQSQGVNKKSEESNAYFGITGEISEFPYAALATPTSAQEIWKTGFDSIKVKVGNNKYVIPGAIVSDKNGESGGVLVSTNKPESEVTVTWLVGPKSATIETVPASTVEDTESWMSPETAKTLGVTVDSDAIAEGSLKISDFIKNLEIANEAFIKSKQNQVAINKLKKSNSVMGTGASPVEVSGPLSWDVSDFENVASLNTTLELLAVNPSKAMSGQEVLIDSGDIEDNKVRIYSTYNANGDKSTRLTFTLTSWATDSDEKSEHVGIIDKLANNPEVSKSSRLKYRAFQRLQDKLVENGVWTGSFIDSGSEGATYSFPLKDADGVELGTISIHRANKDGSTPKFLGKNNAPIAYHNKVDISIKGDATSEQVEAALKAAGVSEARPATKDDVRIIAENKLIGLFGQKADGSINYKGELRQKILDDVKAQYGVTADDIQAVQDPSGDIYFLMPESFGEAMAKATNTSYFRHSWNGYLEGTTEQQAEFLYNLLAKDGLRSTTHRWGSGINTSGKSSESDGYRVGANYVFTSKYSGAIPTSSGALSFYFDAKQVLRRLDFYANKSDSFGAKSEKDMLQELGGSHVYEILFKGSLSWADLAGISVDSATRALLVQKLLDGGITKFGDKTVQQVIGGTK